MRTTFTGQGTVISVGDEVFTKSNGNEFVIQDIELSSIIGAQKSVKGMRISAMRTLSDTKKPLAIGTTCTVYGRRFIKDEKPQWAFELSGANLDVASIDALFGDIE